MNTQYEFTQYAKPQLMNEAPPSNTPYSAQQWAQMTNHEPQMGYDVAFQISQNTHNLYKSLNRDMDIQSMYLHGSPIHLQSIPEPSPSPSVSSSSNVVMAGADWCGFTKKSKIELQKRPNSITQLQCQDDRGKPGKDVQHPACKMTKGFPTFYQKTGSSYKMIQNGMPMKEEQWNKLLQ